MIPPCLSVSYIEAIHYTEKLLLNHIEVALTVRLQSSVSKRRHSNFRIERSVNKSDSLHKNFFASFIAFSLKGRENARTRCTELIPSNRPCIELKRSLVGGRVSFFVR
jgi:hypothetical protein